VSDQYEGGGGTCAAPAASRSAAPHRASTSRSRTPAKCAVLTCRAHTRQRLRLRRLTTAHFLGRRGRGRGRGAGADGAGVPRDALAGAERQKVRAAVPAALQRHRHLRPPPAPRASARGGGARGGARGRGWMALGWDLGVYSRDMVRGNSREGGDLGAWEVVAELLEREGTRGSGGIGSGCARAGSVSGWHCAGRGLCPDCTVQERVPRPVCTEGGGGCLEREGALGAVEQLHLLSRPRVGGSARRGRPRGRRLMRGRRGHLEGVLVFVHDRNCCGGGTRRVQLVRGEGRDVSS
jgi:hypothetical protein